MFTLAVYAASEFAIYSTSQWPPRTRKLMPNYIESAQVDIHNGLLSGIVSFHPGLNLISGENGTLKTKLLQSLKSGAQIRLHDPNSPCTRQAVSPKRNAQRRAFQQVFDQLRRNNTTLDGLINERNINDGAFEDYPAIGDLFYVVYDDLCKDGGNLIAKMNEAAREFNAVMEEFSRTTSSSPLGVPRGARVSSFLRTAERGSRSKDCR